MGDYIVRATAAGAQIRAFAATTRQLVETARERHNTSPVATAALGRLLTAGCMMGCMLKGEHDKLTLRITGDGALGGLTVTADSRGNVKGYALCPGVMLPPSRAGKLDVGGAIGQGVLQVVKDMGLREPYAGETALQTGEIGEDLAYYFATSEQVPSSVGLGVLMNRNNTVRQAGGFIVQLMPYADEAVLERLEGNVQKIKSVTSVLDAGNGPRELLEMLLDGLEMEITQKIPARFLCNCGKEKVEQAIVSIGREEIEDMIAEGKPITVNCHFCNTDYTFSVDELREILQRAVGE